MRADVQESIALLRKGDAESVQRALSMLRRTVLSFGIKLCGHHEDAEDTAQEVLVHALPYLAKLEDAEALSAWLYTAAKNRCWQGRRTASYRRSVALDELIPADSELQELLLADGGANPEEEVGSREDQQLLHRAVLALPPQYRMVLVLHDMEELNTEVVGRILSLQPGTVRVRLHRARLLLRQEMGRLLRGEESSPPKRPARRQPVECREIFANLSEYLDGELAARDCERMQRHIHACPACVAFIQDLKRAIDRCRTLDVCPEQETQPMLRRLLTEEYLRLKKSSLSL